MNTAINAVSDRADANSHRTPRQILPVVYTAISTLGAAVAALVNVQEPLHSGAGLAVAVAAGALAVTSWRKAPGRPATNRWVPILIWGGGTLVASTAVIALVELPAAWWFPSLIAFLGGVMATTVGLILAIAHVLRGRRAPQSPGR